MVELAGTLQAQAWTGNPPPAVGAPVLDLTSTGGMQETYGNVTCLVPTQLIDVWKVFQIC